MWERRIKSFKYAFQGLATLYRTQFNFRFHLLALLVVIALGFGLRVTATEWVLLILASGMVLSLEGMNTALEFLTDLVSPDYHELAGKAKDVAAASVLISALAALVIGFLIFLPKILTLF